MVGRVRGMEEPVPSYVEIYADAAGTSHLRDVEVPF
jgi:hypothetical protein